MNNYTSQLFGLENKVAIVTGATRGLGQGMALGLGKAGAKLAVIGSSEKNLAATLKECDALNIEALPLACDQRDKAAIKSTVEQVASHYGQIDVLVNNAGTIRRAPAAEYSDDDWDDVIETNLNGVFRFSRAVGKIMLEQGNGSIINIASLLSFSGGITVPSYAASKGGVAQLTKALANEWAKDNVRVNAIAPGYFNTDNTENLRKDAQRFESISARIPAGRWGDPEDLAGAAVFLASDASSYVNGHVMLVDGGWMAR